MGQAEVARRLRVSRQTVGRWISRRRISGVESLRRSSHVGRRRHLSAEQREILASLLAGPPEAVGYEPGPWTSARVAHLIESRFGVIYHPGHVWKLLASLLRGSKGGTRQIGPASKQAPGEAPATTALEAVSSSRNQQ
jgi:transposase